MEKVSDEGAFVFLVLDAKQVEQIYYLVSFELLLLFWVWVQREERLWHLFHVVVPFEHVK